MGTAPHTPRCIKVLLVEDSHFIAAMIEKYLQDTEDTKFDVTHVGDLSTAMVSAVEGEFDVILQDLGLPDSHGLSTLTQMQEKAADIPTIVLTALDSEKVALEALRQGAQDYLFKNQVTATLLRRSIRYAIERKKVEEELKKAHRRLKETTTQLIHKEQLSALGELTANVAHELNQPLNCMKIICQSVLRNIEEIEKDELEKDVTEAIGLIDSMAKIIDHMRIFTRRSENVKMKRSDINTIVKRSLELSGQQLKYNDIEMTEELEKDLPSILADTASLEHVFLHLVTNARNALQNCDKKRKEVRIKTYKTVREDQKADIAVEIIDNGVGIPEHIQHKIFHPFFTTNEPSKGIGLGLSLTRKIIEEHNGKIEVESILGKETIFRIHLPSNETE